MPNHVTHKIIFPAERAAEVFAKVAPDGNLNFATLIPQPAHIYLGDLTGEDEADFPCNWLSWNRENWGTKWNAYTTKIGQEGDRAWIEFDTAWSIPYPFLSAFNNLFQMPFEHRYYDEGANFWGIEKWSDERFGERRGSVRRTSKRYKHEDDRRALSIELKGRDPDAEEEAA